MSRAGGDQHALPGKWTRTEKVLDHREDLCWLAETPGAEFAAGHRAFCRADDSHAVFQQRPEIALGRRMLPHLHVHRGRDHDWFVGRQQQG